MAAGRDDARRLGDIVRDGAARLEAAGLDAGEARRDATLLARWCLGWDAATWLRRSPESPPARFAAGFDALVARRASREPVSHLTGRREFYGRCFVVTPDVLTPRPETELVVDEALTALTALNALAVLPAPPRDARPVVLVDVGTGSGCLAVTLALEASSPGSDGPGPRVVAIDRSARALRVARANVRRLAPRRGVRLLRGDLTSCLAAGRVDLVVSNPPYVPERAVAALAPEVRREPEVALLGGPDGLDVIRRLLHDVARVLRPGGWLVMEIGHDQGDAVARLIDAQAGLAVGHVARDLAGHMRVVVARRAGRL